MPDPSPTRGLIDTSVIIGLSQLNAATLPPQMAIATITLAESAAGPHATVDPSERARRQQRLQLAEATFDPLPFDADCARAYGLVYAENARAGRKARGARAVALLIAATALAAKLPLYTANVTDFDAVRSIVDIHAVTLASI